LAINDIISLDWHEFVDGSLSSGHDDVMVFDVVVAVSGAFLHIPVLV
jgi:hypothetical protein